MAAEFPLANVPVSAVELAESALIQLVRAAYPNLDLRRGSVLRELLIRPDATINARETQRYDYLQIVRSLQLILRNPGVATADDVNALLANFALAQRIGSTARGMVKIAVSSQRNYSISENFELGTSDGLVFKVERAYNVKPSPIADELPLYAAPDGVTFYFLLPMVAATPGVASELPEGTSLNLITSLTDFITADVYEAFTGGVEPETVQQLIDRIPAAISHRTLGSRASLWSVLTSPENGNFTELQAVSAQGYGDKAQLRDRHNPHGIATGGKVDVYPRTFVTPSIVTVEKVGTLLGTGIYRIDIGMDDAPGFYDVRSISDVEATFAPSFEFGTIVPEGSYQFTQTRSADPGINTLHDVSGTVEAAFTRWQTATLVVTGVPPDGNGGMPATRKFKVQLYAPPRLREIQEYVDRTDIRQLGADYLVRSPLLCIVSIRATVYASINVSTEAMQQRLQDYINSRSFVSRLSESEIIGVLHEFEISRVNTGDDPITGLQIKGVIRDGAGELHTLGLRDLDVEAAAQPDTLLTPNTVVFAAGPSNIYITVRPA